MSEPLPGFEGFQPEAPAPRDAATVLLWRPAGTGVEVFWTRRNGKVSFAAGFHAFPGGKVDGADAQVAVAGDAGEEASLRVAAARELFEEAGVLAARTVAPPDPGQLRALRRALLDGTLGFGALLGQLGASLHAEDLQLAGRWVTPPYLSTRFDARMFLVQLPPGATAEVWDGELVHGEWVAPRDALAAWKAGRALLHPPQVHALQVMAGFRDVPSALARLRAPRLMGPDSVSGDLEFQAGVRCTPLRTHTLPPATHTNCWVLGHRELLVVDPGPDEAAALEPLWRRLDALAAEGCTVKAVVATHHHGDHVGGLRAVSGRYGVPVWAHALTADRLDLPVARRLEEGEVLELAGTPPMRWRVAHTPGHARGHVCLVDEASRAVVVGDMVAGVGTIVIDPPEGDMADYLAQLRRLEALPVGTLCPAHGPVIPDGPGKLREYLQHRELRAALVLEATPEAGATLADITAAAYADTPAFLHPVAERSAEATLRMLQAEGKVAQEGERYRRVPC
jgi:glyoxylase-like metal-dependent hydrolase (beta-lactamase superfamily II)/8-oxo-dGTP pyrophosphatase MutT (NUDIX family)